MTKPLRIGLLGAARISPKAICNPARVVSGVKLQGVAARDRQRANLFAETHGIAEVFDSYESLVESDEIDLIYNPLPINRHAEWTIRALEAGKHVFCEKPFAMNAGEADAMLDAADRAGKRVIEAFHNRYHPAFEQCLAWICEGRIGDIQSLDGVFNVEIRDSDTEIRHLIETGGGAMMDLGCYPLNWILQIMGTEPDRVEAEAKLTRRGVDETMEATLHFGEGAKASIRTHMGPGTPFEAKLRIVGTKGKIEFENPVQTHINGALTLTGENGHETVRASPISTYTWQLEALALGLASGAPLPTEGEAIARQQRQLDAIYDAAGLRHLRYR